MCVRDIFERRLECGMLDSCFITSGRFEGENCWNGEALDDDISVV